MSKYTPGPWKQHPVHSNQILGCDDVESNISATVAIVYGYNQEQVNANSHLISAAPDLLEVVQALLAARELPEFQKNPELLLDENCPLIDEARQARAKARGDHE